MKNLVKLISLGSLLSLTATAIAETNSKYTFSCKFENKQGNRLRNYKVRSTGFRLETSMDNNWRYHGTISGYSSNPKEKSSGFSVSSPDRDNILLAPFKEFYAFNGLTPGQHGVSFDEGHFGYELTSSNLYITFWDKNEDALIFSCRRLN